MPIYHCMHCGFDFKRTSKPDCCPDCGKPEIRLALESEKKEFEERQKTQE